MRSERSATGRRRVFHSLDAIRGIAALAVVTRHCGPLLPTVPLSYLAVDLFFVLSGFVIAFAYEDRLLDSEPVSRFLALRIIRLYPLYLVGLVLSVVYLAAFDLPAASVAQRASWIAAAAFMLPDWMSGWPNGDLFRPRWSLTYELVANVAYAVVARALTVVLVLLICAASAIAMYARYRVGGAIDAGWAMPDAGYAVARVCFSFFAGVFCYRLHMAQVRPVAIGLALALEVVLLAVIWSTLDIRHAGPFTVIVLVWPLLVLFATRFDASARWAAVCSFLGVASYAVYVLHHPASVLLSPVLLSIAGGRTERYLAGACFVLFLLGLSWLLDRCYDKPVRRWLARRLG